jgi:hypothetical protein
MGLVLSRTPHKPSSFSSERSVQAFWGDGEDLVRLLRLWHRVPRGPGSGSTLAASSSRVLCLGRGLMEDMLR